MAISHDFSHRKYDYTIKSRDNYRMGSQWLKIPAEEPEVTWYLSFKCFKYWEWTLTEFTECSVLHIGYFMWKTPRELKWLVWDLRYKKSVALIYRRDWFLLQKSMGQFTKQALPWSLWFKFLSSVSCIIEEFSVFCWEEDLNNPPIISPW